MARKDPNRSDRTGSQAVPAPDDLAGWKAVSRRLCQRMSDEMRRASHLWSAQPVKRYFDDENLDYFLDEHEDRGVAEAYTSWVILDYGRSPASSTHAEKMLREGLPKAEAILLRAMMASCPSLYRIVGHDQKAGTVSLEDVLLGGAVAIHDQRMSESIENGLFLAMRAVPAGGFHFLQLAGPPLGAGMGMEALDYLRSCGMEFTRDGLLRDAHLLGWLWNWIDGWERNAAPPRLTNTEGDDISLHTASFAIANEPEVRRALLQRADIRHEGESDLFIWCSQESRGARVLGGPVTLGTIELVAGELVLMVNSANRLSKAREWLEQLPGVVFQDVQTRPWDETIETRPMDERISPPEPVEITPDLAASLQDMFNRQYMGWLDTPLPVLGGKSPRQACRTAEGRQEVAMLIRTIPDPMGPAPVQVPRAAMLRELGIGGEGSASSGAGPSKPVPPSTARNVPDQSKVGRNDPCPCGSGRKYKKCCGR